MKVLIVDDSSYNLLVLQELVKEVDEDFEIEMAMNGQEALDRILSNVRQQKAQYAVILLDINMPVMEGI